MGCTIGPHEYAAVWLDGPGTFDIQGSSLSGSRGVSAAGGTIHGNALFAEHGIAGWDGLHGLRLADSTLLDGAGIAVLLDGSSALLSANVWSGNGTDLRQQSCDGVVPISEGDALDIPTALICPAGNVLTAYDLAFSSLYLPVPDTP